MHPLAEFWGKKEAFKETLGKWLWDSDPGELETIVMVPKKLYLWWEEEGVWADIE